MHGNLISHPQLDALAIRFARAGSIGLAALAFFGSPAQAAGGGALSGTFGSTPGVLASTTPLNTQTMTINVAGIESRDTVTTPGNVNLSFAAPANSELVGIGWDVTLTAVDPSWLREIAVSFRNAPLTEFFRSEIFIHPGFGVANEVPGTRSFSSGGVINLLTAVGETVPIDAAGYLNIEFYEDFNDLPGADGQWDSGTITLVFATSVPEVSSYALMAVGLMAVGATARRRGRAER